MTNDEGMPKPECRGNLSRLVVLSLWATGLFGHGTLAEAPANSGADQIAGAYLDVGGCKIYYEERGSGPAIILLHDGLLHSVTWDEVWQPLATKYHVIRYDQRGYGRSDPATSSFSPAGDLAKLLRHLQVQHAVVVGNSSGGALGIDFALEYPAMVDGLFLLGPVLHGMEYSAEFRERANRNNEPMERDDARGMAQNWSQDRFLVAGPKEKVRRKIYEQLVANAQKLKTYDGALEEQFAPPASKRLGEIRAPAMVLVGEADIMDVHAHCAAITAGIRDSEQVVIKNAGHLIQLEQPEDVVKRLEDFVRRCANFRK